MVDGEDKNDMGYLYEAMDKAKERLRARFKKAPPQGCEAHALRWDRLSSGWDRVALSLPPAALFSHGKRTTVKKQVRAYYLHLAYHYAIELSYDDDLTAAFTRVVERLSRSALDAKKSLEPLLSFFRDGKKPLKGWARSLAPTFYLLSGETLATFSLSSSVVYTLSHIYLLSGETPATFSLSSSAVYTLSRIK
ncbi:hypothetical protein Taro_045197 [Colocasia esculenta]|uniref:Uncharacterized protein n=1 Tax=Colocasia esculenta TaxID=4460 RepID=A0A843WNU7_COLES|nr:hypothetical protein [Colocasia esculenta]